MSEENADELGRLLLRVGNASRHLWSIHGFDLLLFEHALAAIRVGWRETAEWRAVGSPHGISTRDTTQARVQDTARLPIDDLLDQDPANRLVRRASVRTIAGREGTVLSALRMTLEDGEKLKWMWSKRLGPPAGELEAAVRQFEAAGLAG
jgi:hypothetical protein